MQPPEQPPYSQPPTQHFQVSPQPVTGKRNNVPWIVGGVVAVVALCCGGTIIAGALAPEETKKPDAVATQSPLPVVQPAAVPTPAPAEASTPAAPTAPAVASVVMPNLINQNAAVAKDTLEKLGFPADRVTLGSQDVLDNWVLLPQNWTVKKQSVKPGKRVRLDTLIALTCTKTG